MGSVSISIDPFPPTAGQSVKIITAGLPAGHEIKIDLDPPADPTSISVGEDGMASFVIPDGSRTMIVSDPESGTEAATAIRWR